MPLPHLAMRGRAGVEEKWNALAVGFVIDIRIVELQKWHAVVRDYWLSYRRRPIMIHAAQAKDRCGQREASVRDRIVRSWKPCRYLATAIALAVSIIALRAQEPEAFYKNKSLTLIVSSDVGGGFDAYSRSLA